MVNDMLLLVSAAHAEIHAGLGLRRVTTLFDGAPTSVHAFGRVHVNPRVAFELGGSLRFPGDAMQQMVPTLLLVAHDTNPESTDFQVSVAREMASVAAYAELSPWARLGAENLSVWVYGAAGVELRFQRTDIARLEYDPSDVSSMALTRGVTLDTLPTPAAGVGFDLWFHDRVGMRLLLLGRVASEREPDYGNETETGEPEPLEERLATSAALNADVLVRF